MLPIAKSAYNFIKFDWGIFRFIDSRIFINSSEEKLADQLAIRSIAEQTGTYKKAKDGNIIENFDKFVELRKYFEKHSIERLRKGDWRLLTRKGALPYEYIYQSIILKQNYLRWKNLFQKLLETILLMTNTKKWKIYGVVLDVIT